jgi:uncharacterized phage protein gp47/JayE
MVLVRKAYPEITSDLLDRVAAGTDLTNFNVGSVIRTLLEAYGAVAADLNGLAFDVLAQGFLESATGIYLDAKAAELGVTRHPACAVEGTVRFYRNLPKNANVPVSAGTLVSTFEDAAGKAYRYVTTAAAVLASGQVRVVAPVQALDTGATANVGPGSIRKLVNPIPGIDGVENPVGWITAEGRDEETDDALRRRCFLAWAELTRGSTADAYRSWALSVPGVADAFVRDNEPRGAGTVDVFILGAGGMPSADLIAAAQVVVDERKPLCADALVRGPVAREIPVAMTVAALPRFSQTVIDEEIRRRLAVHFTPTAGTDYPSLPRLGVGTDVLVSRIVSLVMGVPGVHNVRLVSPAADVAVHAYELAVLGAVAIAFEEAA